MKKQKNVFVYVLTIWPLIYLVHLEFGRERRDYGIVFARYGRKTSKEKLYRNRHMFFGTFHIFDVTKTFDVHAYVHLIRV